MKINLKISQDGMNYESFQNVEFPKLDNKSEDVVKNEVESYCHSALGSMITKEILEMKVSVNNWHFATLFYAYFEAVKEMYPDIADRVKHLIEDLPSDESLVILIDDLIGVLQAAKPV